MLGLFHDLRYATRTVVRNQMVSGLAILAFALGIGVTTAVFSIFTGVLLKPLPFPHPEELVRLYDTQPACDTCPASFPKYHDWRTHNTVFAAIAGSTSSWLVLTGHGDPERLVAMQTTASLVDVLGAQPMLGRWFTEDEDRDGGRRVVVLSHAFWTARLSAGRSGSGHSGAGRSGLDRSGPGRSTAGQSAPDKSILGRTLLLDGTPYEVIGVMPPGFSHGNGALFVPLARKLDPTTRGSHFLAVFARLKPGMSVERATTEMRALGQTLARDFGHNHGIDVRLYAEEIVGNVRRPMQILLGAVFLVLLIACANVANLLLASGLARRRELAIRVALGAGQRHLARQLTAEALVLALAGGVLGLLLALWAVRTFVVLAGNHLPRATSIAIDGPVLAFAAGLSLLVGLFCGLWPLITLRARELASAIREGDTRTVSGVGRRFGNGLVIAEIALAFTLLVGAALLVKNLVRLQSRDAGIRTERVIAFDLQPVGPRYKSTDQVRAFYRELYPRLAAMGGVEKVGFVSHLPMYRFGYNGEMSIEGGNSWGANEAPLVEYRWIYGQYFQTLGVPLLGGRLLDDRDRPDSTTVLINQAMADKFWPGQEALGKRFGQGDDRSRWYQVVGVVGNVRSYGLAARSPYEFYRTIEQSSFSALTVVVRASSADPSVLVPTARQIVRDLDATMPMTSVQTMETVVAASVGQPRLMSALTGVFGGLAGLLAIVGVYGVMAYNVRRQRREFGIRLALGARASAVERMVVGRGLVLAVTGVILGAAGAWFLTGLLRTMLADVTPTDPWVFTGTAGAVLLVAMLASYLPARTAGKVDPMIALRD